MNLSQFLYNDWSVMADLTCQWIETIPNSHDFIHCSLTPIYIVGGWYPQYALCEIHLPVMLDWLKEEVEYQFCFPEGQWLYWKFHLPLLMRAPIRGVNVIWDKMELVTGINHIDVMIGLSKLTHEA